MTAFQENGARWVCCHLGAREHYAVPRALQLQGRLGLLVTDAWVRPGSPWSRLPGNLPRRLAERFHPDLADAAVRHFTGSLVAREAWWRWQRWEGWTRPMLRNRWFGHRAAAALDRVPAASGKQTVVFAHSYSACEVFRHAKARGWMTVLGQIDPGEEHFRIAQRLSAGRVEYGGPPPMPPAAYFASWREECAMADRIVVNSEWAREALGRARIPAGKLSVIPLAYTSEVPNPATAHVYPDRFTRDRPLRLLFVGHAAVAKGVPELLEAVAALPDVPLALRLVGETAMSVPARFLNHPAIQWVGPLSRGDVMRHYRECDVLVFPSHSDGFGMAQIEAQAFRLPIIASRHCGQVVRDGVNGILLPEVTAAAIAAALRRVSGAPELLAAFSGQADAGLRSPFGELSSALLALEPR